MNIGVHGSFRISESHLIVNEAFVLKDRGQGFDCLTAPLGLADTSFPPTIHLFCWPPCGWWQILPALTSRRCFFSHLLTLLPLACQGQELTIRQISLLGFRDLVLLKVKLDDLLLLAQPQLPSSIVQMLLILQVRPGGDITAG